MKGKSDQSKIEKNDTFNLERLQLKGEGDAVKVETQAFPIIGLGGASGSVVAFEQFFKHMPTDAGMAFIIVIHQDPKEQGNYLEVLKSFTSMPVQFAEDGAKVIPNHVYLAPMHFDIGLHDGYLLLFKAAQNDNTRMCIDHFFQSLAEDQWNMAVGILFSGLGADGETGLRMIKEKLGMTMVQDPEDATYASMPMAAITTHQSDYILLPEEMPGKLIKYLSHPVLGVSIEDIDANKTNKVHIQKIIMILRSHTGHDFSLYKKNTISRRIERRIAFHQLPDYEHYVNYLRENPAEVDILFNELLIGVTKFFRDKPAFETLTEHMYPLLGSKNPEEPIRIWIAGCSTGEEAYTVAIIITEYLDALQLKRKPKAQIFATDLDANAIEVARTGFYFSNIASELSPERLERFFERKNNGYTVKKEIREMIVFAQHNLIKDAPFTRLDLLCCRNVMIYLTTELQKKLIPIFHYSLNVNGLLFLGPAESVSGFQEFFNNVDSKWKLFERKEGASSMGKLLDFPFHIANQDKLVKSDMSSKSRKQSPIVEHFNKILLDNHTPPSLLLNDKGEIIDINGATQRFIHLHPGEAVMNIHRMIREELKYALGNALHQASTKKIKVEINDVKIKENDKLFVVNVTVDYIHEPALQGMLLVTFFERPAKKMQRRSKQSGANEGVVEELEKELTYTKQQLHTTIEQMETSLEELKSTNEELQSTNEELQSTNEEALTTKEEMQSLNEELMTINLQYQTKAEELTQLNNDMKNLLDNIEIGTIFLDNHLNILRFTPQVTKLFNVIASDIGRSITHIVSNFEYPAIEQTIKEVIITLNGRELEVKTKKNEWYNLRIMPYRTMDNFISGAVLTFTKITPLKSISAQVRGLLKYTQSIIEQFDEATLILASDKKVLAANRKFTKLFQLVDSEIREHSFLEIVNNKWKMKVLAEKLSAPVPIIEHFYEQHHFNGIGMLNLDISIQRIAEDGHKLNLLVLKFKEK
ncbi:CheR family methyltransferase [Pedobacter endophyticus]|uniref:protein-glutamate O-methyltransferase n=1 Tax=Pedobacter endophyticus TaxID=2789740 RepID=A0A7S9Q043_9SPHI|nr:CheR family methyltransferase [Pedobacter endophyticus]QPH41268.1 PAS domain-containing protein [Pedobacter endophyticus]